MDPAVVEKQVKADGFQMFFSTVAEKVDGFCSTPGDGSSERCVLKEKEPK